MRIDYIVARCAQGTAKSLNLVAEADRVKAEGTERVRALIALAKWPETMAALAERWPDPDGWEPTPHAYAERGFHPIELWGLVEPASEAHPHGVCCCPKGARCGRSAGKHPRDGGWQTAVHPDLTTDGNLGLRMGGGIIAIDVDGPWSLITELEEKLGPLPPTMTGRTGGGGFHLLFRVGVPLRNTAGRLAHHIDTRADGGQIVAPPSLHQSGVRYQWLDQRAPADLPDRWVAELVDETSPAAPPPELPAQPDDPEKEYGRLALRRAVGAVATAPDGTANDTLNREAYSLGGLVGNGALEAGEAVAGLRAAAAARGWEKDKAEDVIERGLTAGVAKPRAVSRMTKKRQRPPPASESSAAPVLDDEDPPGVGAPPAQVIRLDTGLPVKEWMAGLLRLPKGGLRPALTNAALYLRHHAEFEGVLAWDSFAQRTVARRAPPGGLSGQSYPRPWTNRDDSLSISWLERQGVCTGSEMTRRAVGVVAEENSYHPVREYLESLTWDGKPRLHTWLTIVYGPPECTYLNTIGSCWLVSAVARVMRPGCKADHVLVLEGPEGTKKSTSLSVLAGSEWFTDHLASLESKDAVQQLGGRWIVELQELAAVRRSAWESVISFLTTRTDYVRLPYEARVSELPRQCVFAATVNPAEYFHEDQGKRRFWPVKVTRVDLDWLERNRDQLWAEALSWYLDGKTWYLDADTERLAREEQEQRRVEDPWEDTIRNFLEPYEQVTSIQVYGHIGLDRSKLKQADRNRVGSIMRIAGWERRKVRVSADKTENRWVKRS